MSENNPIRVFVAHNFEESFDYLRVFEFLESMERFYYLNVSKPEQVPGSGGIDAIKEELIQQIKTAEAVVILASLYTEKPVLTKFQMDIAEANKVPTIAIQPFGGLQESPEELVERASDHIEWNERKIADALRRHARMEDTSRWDVIDFP